MAGGELSKLRRGIPPHKKVTLGNGEDSADFMVVLLSADKTQELDELTEEYARENEKKVNQRVRNSFYSRMLCAMCLRSVDDKTLSEEITTYEEVGKILDSEDIDRICTAYKELMVNKAPKVEVLNDEQLEEIKNYLEVTSLKDLSTVLQVHLKSCHQTIVSER